ncbi:Mur ligase family protein, partial [Neisseria sp. WF04]|uniref:Mur ligase family protein n=1 Tax=unclassified Neisseria TaxID=2623750 RepID=UPI001FD753D7
MRLLGQGIRYLTTLRGGGSAFPGLVMERLHPGFVAEELAKLPHGVVLISGTNGKTTTARLIAHLFSAQGLRVGMTNTDGVYVNGRQIDSGDCSGPRSARNVLLHPEVDAAVFETARGGILREGLG